MPAIDGATLAALLNKNPLDVDESNTSRTAVESRCVSSFDYDLLTETLTVSFPGSDGTGGRGTWEYSDFPLSEFTLFAGSFSLGTYFNLYIRERYSTRRIA
jgi:hypothetical protein